MKPTGVPHMGSTALYYYISYGDLFLTPIVLGLDNSVQQCFPEYQLCARHCARHLGRRIKMIKKVLALKEHTILREKDIYINNYKYRE